MWLVRFRWFVRVWPSHSIEMNVDGIFVDRILEGKLVSNFRPNQEKPRFRMQL